MKYSCNAETKKKFFDQTMRLLLYLAFLAMLTPSLQQAANSTTNSTSDSSVTVTTTVTPAPSLTLDCPARCARIYRPVCARVRGQRHTYANICLMRSAINCARRRGVTALYRIRFIRRGRCNSRRRRRRRPSRGGRRPRPNLRSASTGGKAVNSRVLNSSA